MSQDVKLLPLPEHMKAWAHSLADDAQAYARANMEPLIAENERLREKCDRLQRQLRQAHKDYGYELRDPNGTIWEHAAKQQARAERLAEDAERLDWLTDRMRITDLHHILGSVPMNPRDLRAAIDQARGKGGGQ